MNTLAIIIISVLAGAFISMLIAYLCKKTIVFNIDKDERVEIDKAKIKNSPNSDIDNTVNRIKENKSNKKEKKEKKKIFKRIFKKNKK